MRKTNLLLSVFFLCCLAVGAQNSMERQIADSLTFIVCQYSPIDALKTKEVQIKVNSKTQILTVNVSEKLSYIPFREENVERIYKAIKSITSSKYADYKIVCITDTQPIENLVPNFFRKKTSQDKLRKYALSQNLTPLVMPISKPYSIDKGLKNRYLALWHSHGLYYNQQSARWEWQRARLNQTVEDIYTLSYTLPYLVPMLENAGATVLMPRERDTQIAETVIDNDNENSKSEIKTHRHWRQSADSTGFGRTKTVWLFGENPFRSGTYLYATTTSDPDHIAKVEWIPNFTQAGRYAVYVSYKSLENSATNALYTVFHAGGQTQFKVNQRMGGGTWIYLGTFNFEKGKNSEKQRVELSSLSNEIGKVVVADAVRFGGGMGNIARKPTLDSLVYQAETSGRPRWTEGARYWLQWAGTSDSIYSRTANSNDYTDDLSSRGAWVNWLKGELKIPIDMALAIHSDAGLTAKDSIIGTLGIVSVTKKKSTLYANSISRWAARDLADIVQSQVVSDIRQQIAPEWTRRNLWNKSYSESREPEVPAALLELLSHQNFSDMRYGLDPRFQFIVSRAIYKGILRYLSNTYGTEYAVQPLPVNAVSCCFTNDNSLKISWKPTIDSIEPTAMPENYIVYTRIDGGGFDNGTVVTDTELTLSAIEKGKIYSFKIAALNQGGESFPSEIISACAAQKNKGTVLIINAFDRISAPESFMRDTLFAGFQNEEDAGVPYLYSMSYTGAQYDFDFHSAFMDNDSPGFGASASDFEGQVIAGNSFDYPYIHGQAIRNAGFSFVSASKNAVLQADSMMQQYKLVDIILGKQKKTRLGNGKRAAAFETFSPQFQQKIKNFLQQGGSLLVSGAHIGSDLSKNGTASDKFFLENTLRCRFVTAHAAQSGQVKIVLSPLAQFLVSNLSFYTSPNSFCYFVENPDALAPSAGAHTIARYADGNRSAAVAYANDKQKICVFAFPLETVKDEKSRHVIFRQIFDFLE